MDRDSDFAAHVAELQRQRPRLDRASTASRVAEILRDLIVEGVFQPGGRLPEQSVRSALGVSRNTLREAFQQLIRERLLVHELSRGVFVRQLIPDDIVDLYRVRRLVECTAIREANSVCVPTLRDLQAAIDAGEEAAGRHEWRAVGAASIRFHQALVTLAGSARLDELMRQILAEFRLAYAAMTDPRAFHEPFLARHPTILEPIQVGQLDMAADRLHQYLNDAEERLLTAYATGRGLPSP